MIIIKPKQRLAFMAALLVIFLVIAYSNTFNAPFIFDDAINIVENASIRQLWPPWRTFSIPFDTGLAGRPVINFTLAVNHAVSGCHVWSYHAVNLSIHILAALMLFIIMLRILSSSEMSVRYGAAAVPFSFVCALLWGLHPIQTQAVTYISQRCESLMALFVLATYYLALCGWQSSSRVWHLAAVMTFLLGVFSKEVAVAAPLILLSYEWVFLGRSPLRAIRKSPLLYAGIILGILLTVTITLHENTFALRTEGNPFTPLEYWITQFPVILHYVRLVLWPSGLAIDYGWPAASLQEAWPAAAVTVSCIALSFWALWRRKAAGFLGAWFFFFLAPSSVVPLPDIAFEHRMYLPSAAIVILIVAAAFHGYESFKNRDSARSRFRKILSPAGLMTTGLCLALVLGVLTYARNYDYRSEMAIWSDTIQKRPENFRGYHGVAMAFSKEDKLDQALTYLHRALRLNPKNAYVHNDIGFVLFKANRSAEAIPFFQEAVRLKPNYPKLHNNLGASLAKTGRLEEAIQHHSIALWMKPDYEGARNNLAKAAAELAREKSGKDAVR
jgi:protein O-mannosyl-transferase